MRWARRHPIISSVVGALVLLFVLAGIFGKSPKKSGQKARRLESTTTAAPATVTHSSSARPQSTATHSTTTRATATRAQSAPPGNTVAATAYWRQQVQGQYGYPVALGDGRGCARASPTRWICTAYVKNPSKDVDVYGTVVRIGQSYVADAHLNHGSQITDWFTRSGGGCQTNTCSGTKIGPG